MNKILKRVLITVVVLFGLLIIYKLAFIRTVNYQIAGIVIPSKYNVLTGNVKPILDYKGKTNLKIVQSQKSNKVGLSEEQVVIAKLRWAIFEQWANSRPEYKGWQNDAKIFKKANDDFRKQIKFGQL